VVVLERIRSEGIPPPGALTQAHPWGCHRRRMPDRVLFDHVLAALVHGSGYERIASPGYSDHPIRRRSTEWTEHGRQLLRLVLAAFDRMIGPQLDDLAYSSHDSPTPRTFNCRSL
jgi:hypothetical protein